MTQTSKEDLKAMLEATDRADKGLPPLSPLAEINPQSLDELFLRIDKSLQLHQIPNPADREAVIKFYRAERLLFAQKEAEEAQKPKPARGGGKTPKSIKEALDLSLDLI